MTDRHVPCKIEDEFVEAAGEKGEVSLVLGPRGLVHPQHSVCVDRGINILETELVGWKLKQTQ